MKLINCIIIVLVPYLCKALQNSSTHADQVQGNLDGNNTVLNEKLDSDPFVFHLDVKCIWTLRMRGNRSSHVVALTADSTDVLAEQICQDSGCGGVYKVEGRLLPNTTCFHNCFYHDGRLQNCSHSERRNCTAITKVVCDRQVVRLTGGADRCAGRVELWRDGKWGTVCDDQWDLTDAEVVCKQLGCGYTLNVSGQGGPFPPGRGPIQRDDLNCSGSEENLWDCPAAQDEHDCGHKEDAGVVCSEMKAVRLSGGLDRCSGKVEVHRNGSWGTVCDNCWNKHLASMVCSMLQCGSDPQKFTQFDPHLTHNNGPLWFYFCDKNHQDLWQCTEYVNRTHLCKHSRAAGVICNGSRGFPVVTTANTTLMTSWTTETITTIGLTENFLLTSLTPELITCFVLAFMLLMALAANAFLCCHYRRKQALVFQQKCSNPPPSSEHQTNSYQDAVNLIKLTDNPVQRDDSQRYRTDTNPLMKHLGSLSEEANVPRNEEEGNTGVFTSYNGGPIGDDYTRVSKNRNSMDSFESSSTSSGEYYENTTNDTTNAYVVVDPDPCQSVTDDSSRLVFSNDQLYSGQANTQNSGGLFGDEEDEPLYSPVSPDCNPSASEDDYDDIGTD